MWNDKMHVGYNLTAWCTTESCKAPSALTAAGNIADQFLANLFKQARVSPIEIVLQVYATVHVSVSPSCSSEYGAVWG